MLGGKPDSRLQGCHFLTLTETNPKTEEGGEGGGVSTKGIGIKKSQMLSLGSNRV